LDGEIGIGIEDGAGPAAADGAATAGAIVKAGGSGIVAHPAGGTETINNR